MDFPTPIYAIVNILTWNYSTILELLNIDLEAYITYL